jgi:hypothetical protein
MHAKLVAIRITEIGAIVVCVVLRPQARLAFTRSPVRETDLIGGTHDFSAGSRERNHLPVPRVVRPAVVRLADDKERARAILAVPTRPGPLWFTEAKLNAKAFHQRAIERKGARKVCNADEDVREHGAHSVGRAKL